jgi:methyltransferase-like protein
MLRRLTVSERPLASPLARLQAQTQSQVANLRHQIAELNPLEQKVLPLLDGEHDLAALLPPLLQATRSGALSLERGKSAERDGTTLREVLIKQLPATLHTLAGCALLVS